MKTHLVFGCLSKFTFEQGVKLNSSTKATFIYTTLV